MKLFIIETGETKTLTLPCPKTGCCYAADFIQGHDITTVENEDGDDVQAMTAEAFAWLANVIAKQAVLDQRIADLVEEHGSEAVYAVVHRIAAGYYDLENEADMINSALDSEFGAQAE